MSYKRTKPTESFEKYIDPIFIIQNNLMSVAPKKFCERFDTYEYSLQTYHDEQLLRAGMCVKLAEKIQKHLKFNNTHVLYVKRMMEVATNSDYDYIQAENTIKSMDKTLFSHAKLEFCFEKFFKDITLNNNLEILAYLMAIYEKIMSMKKVKFPQEQNENVALSKWYRYVRFAFLEEEAVDIKDWSKLSLQEICDNLFNVIVDREFWLRNSTTETMLSSDMENTVMDIFVDDGCDFDEFKNQFEKEVYNYMIEKIHSRENNL